MTKKHSSQDQLHSDSAKHSHASSHVVDADLHDSIAQGAHIGDDGTPADNVQVAHAGDDTAALNFNQKDDADFKISGAHVVPTSASESEFKSSHTEYYIKKRKKRKTKSTKQQRTLKITLIVIASLLGLCLLAGIGLFAAISIGKENLTNVEMTEGKVVEYNGNKYVYNDKNINIMVMGYDKNSNDYAGVSGQADFLLLLSLDTASGKIKGISIPRDTMVKVQDAAQHVYATNGDLMQICLAYAYGDGAHGSCQATCDAASRLLSNMPINHYVSLNMDGIAPINDSIGGVTLVPLQSIPNTGIVKGEKFTLLGKNAQSYVRWRNKDTVDASEQRRARQIQYIDAFYKQALGTSSNPVGTAINLYNTATQYICTNLGLPEFTYLAQVAVSKGISTPQISAVPGQYTQGPKYVEFYADPTKTFELVLDTFYNKQ